MSVASAARTALYAAVAMKRLIISVTLMSEWDGVAHGLSCAGWFLVLGTALSVKLHTLCTTCATKADLLDNVLAAF